MQQSTKVDQEAYSRTFLVLRLEPDLVSNTYTYAKQILGSYESEQDLFPTQQSPQKVRGTSKRTTTEKERKKTKRQTKKANQKKWSRFVFGEKTLVQLYSRGPALFGSSKRFQKHSKLSLAKVKSYLDTEPSFKQKRSIRMQFPTLKKIVKDINGVWSMDLAYVDNLAKYNRDVKYLLLVSVRIP